MSNLRDIQRLRQQRLQPMISSARNSHYRPPDVYNINFDKMADNNKNTAYSSQGYNKAVQSKEMPPSSRDKVSSHKRGASNNVINQPTSPGLSMYNFSLKLTPKAPSNVHSHPEKNLSTNYFQSQPIQLMTSRNIKKQQYSLEVSIKHFESIYPIGKGGFGKVWKVYMKKTSEVYAMKQMFKAKVIKKKSINSVMNERNLLAKIRHPFLINMNYAFQDRQKIYLIMDYVSGGDLRYHICKRRRFSEVQTKFFIANLIISLEYLHKNNIIHRDIKPQNLVFDSSGYIRITDLGVSRQYKEENYQDTSGTPGYMSPEVMCRKNHSFTADYFAVGVMAYEFMLGKRPYVGKSRKQIRDQILSKQASIKIEQLPNRWSLDAADFINRLLLRNPNHRLGASGIEQLKRHDWMKSIDFFKLQFKEIKAPFIPRNIEQNYQDYKQQISEDTIDDSVEENMLMLRDDQVQSLFDGYEYDQNSSFRERRKGNTSSTSQGQSRKNTK